MCQTHVAASSTHQNASYTWRVITNSCAVARLRRTLMKMSFPIFLLTFPKIQLINFPAQVLTFLCGNPISGIQKGSMTCKIISNPVLSKLHAKKIVKNVINVKLKQKTIFIFLLWWCVLALISLSSVRHLQLSWTCSLTRGFVFGMDCY